MEKCLFFQDFVVTLQPLRKKNKEILKYKQLKKKFYERSTNCRGTQSSVPQ